MLLQGRVCRSASERVFGHGGGCSLPRGEIPVHFDTGSLKRRKSLKFAPEMHSSKGRIFMLRGTRLAGSSGETHGEPLVSRTPCAGQRHVCPRRASPCPNRASAGFARCRTGYFLQLFIRAALLAKFLSKPTHTFPNRILAVAYFPALHPPCHLPLYAGCFPKFCLPLLLHM